MNIAIRLPKTEQARLHYVALQYGFNTDELVRRIITDATRSLCDIEEESWDEYENPDVLKKAYKQAVRDDREGKLLTKIPASIRRHRK